MTYQSPAHALPESTADSLSTPRPGTDRRSVVVREGFDRMASPRALPMAQGAVVPLRLVSRKALVASSDVGRQEQRYLKIGTADPRRRTSQRARSSGREEAHKAALYRNLRFAIFADLKCQIEAHGQDQPLPFPNLCMACFASIQPPHAFGRGKWDVRAPTLISLVLLIIELKNSLRNLFEYFTNELFDFGQDLTFHFRKNGGAAT